jgi:gliding motility-associated-like protein
MRSILGILIVFLSFQGLWAHEGEGRAYVFLPNKGQFDPGVRYKAKINGGALFLEDKAWTFHFHDNSVIQKAHLGQEVPEKDNVIRGHIYKVEFVGASVPEFLQEDQTSEYYNFYLGNDPKKWASEVYGFKHVLAKELYPGIQLQTYSQDEKLKYDWIIAPGADPSWIRQRYTGADKLTLMSNGDLVISTSVNQITEQAPKAYQIIQGKKKEIACRFALNGNEITYVFPNGFDAAFELVIDPVLIFGSSTGSTADNFGMTATYSSQGHLFTGGTVFNTGYPTTVGAYSSTSNVVGVYGVTDIVITKFAPNGSTLVYSTYLGGGTTNLGTETVHSLICNANDELFLFGVTSSTDFPTTVGAYDQSHNGGSMIGFYQNGAYFYPSGTDIYVTKFNASGTALLASTFIGGTGNDGVNYNQNVLSGGNYLSAYDSLQTNYGDQFRGEIMVDDLGNCYVATTTKSTDFPTVNAYQSTSNGAQEGIVFKFSQDLSSLIFSTYLGGSNKDACYGIKVDDAYNVYVTGGTCSSNFPTTAGTLHTTYQGGKTDGFAAKLSPNGSTLLASTFLGTNLYDQTFFIELDRYGSVYLLGQTNNPAGMPPVNVAYSNNNSGQFIVKLDNSLSTLQYRTLFGNNNGSFNISPAAFLVDVCGNVYVSGWGANILQNIPLNNMPVTPGAFQSSNGDGFNFYLIVFSRNIDNLLYATYFGGPQSHEHVDGGTSRFDANGIVYQSVCAGCGGYDDFPTTPGAWSNTNNSTNCNNGVFKFDFEIEPEADFTTDQLQGCAPLTIQFDNTSPLFTDYLWDFGNGDTTSLEDDPIRTFPSPGTYTVYLVVLDTICLLQDTAQKVITVYPPLQLSANDTVICFPGNVDLMATSFGTVNNYVWSSNGSFTDTLNNPTTDSTLLVSVTNDSTFYVNVSNAWCSYTDTVLIHIPELDISLSTLPGICTGDTVQLTASNLTPIDPLTFNWSPDSLVISGDLTPTITTSPDYPSWFYVTGTTPQGCTVSDSVFVNVSGPPQGLLNATADQYSITFGSSTVLHANPNGYAYSWSPGETLSDSTSQHPTASPVVTTTYTVTVSNGGCSLSDTVTIRVLEIICDYPYIYVPNAFTPNNDGENDVLYVRGQNITELIFRVFDRWGELVFETTDITKGWDGTFKDREADPAVFVWYVEATCLGGEKYFHKGNVTLIR